MSNTCVPDSGAAGLSTRNSASLIRLHRWSMMLVVGFSLLLLGWLLIAQPIMRFEQDRERMHENFLQEQRELVRSEVDQAIQKIDVWQSQLERQRFDELSNEMSLRQMVLPALAQERFGAQDYGYFAVITLEGKGLMHAIRNPDAVAEDDILDLQSADGQFLIRDIIEIARRDGHGFVRYKWPVPGEQSPETKWTYFRLHPQTQWVVLSGFYPEEFDELMAEREQGLRRNIGRNALVAGLVVLVYLVAAMLVARISCRQIGRLERSRSKSFNLLRQYQDLLDASAIVSKSDLQGNITYVNDQLCQNMGYSREELIGQPHNIFRHPETPREVFSDMWTTIQSGRIWQGVLKNRTREGKAVWADVVIVPIADEYGELTEYIAARNDVTELVAKRQELEHIFHTDALTGLGSRLKLFEDLGRLAHPVLVLIDINDFKTVNDTLGTDAGDDVLRQFADALHREFQPRDYHLFRLEADIFAVLANHGDLDTMIAQTGHFAEHLQERVFQAGGEPVPLNICLGISADVGNPFISADLALADAKRRNETLRVYDASLQATEETRAQFQRIQVIRRAIANDCILPFIQPIHEFAHPERPKFEVLMRLIDDDGKVISPGEFLPIAIKSRLYPQAMRQLIEHAFQYFSTAPGEFSINLTADDLLSAETVDHLMRLIERYDMGKRLIVEIVETEAIDTYEEVVRALGQLRDAGVRVAIDDFGSGFSSFEHLLRLQTDFVKIDGSITRNLPGDETAVALVRSIVEFAHRSGIEVVAEFVGSQELAEFVRELGVDYAQGFYYGKPESPQHYYAS